MSQALSKSLQEILLEPLMFVFAELLVRIQQAAKPDVLLVNLYSQQQFFTSTAYPLMRCFRHSYDIASKIQEVENVEADIRSSQEACSENGRLLAVPFDCKVFNKKQMRK